MGVHFINNLHPTNNIAVTDTQMGCLSSSLGLYDYGLQIIHINTRIK